MLILEHKKKEVIMEIRIQAIHFDATKQLEAFIQKKVTKLEQYFDGIISAEVTLKVVKPETAMNKNANILLKIKNGDCFARMETALQRRLKIHLRLPLTNVWKLWRNN